MNISPLDATLVPIIIALVEVIKRLGINTKYLPLAAIFLGLVGVWVVHQNPEILAGVIMGLAAVGLYSSGSNTLQG